MGSVFFKKNFIPTKKLPLTFFIVLGTVRKPDVGPLLSCLKKPGDFTESEGHKYPLVEL
jgi:hypothetical protein